MSGWANNPRGGGGGLGSIGIRMTDLGKKMMIAIIALYVIQMVALRWLNINEVMYLYLWPFGHETFYPWQLLTHPLMQPTSILGLIFELLMIAFFAAPVEKRLGKKGFLILYFGSIYLASVPGLFITSFLLDAPTPYGGLEVGSLALLTAFGLMNRNASILLFFIIPIQAIWMVIGTAVIIALTFVAKENPTGAYQLIGMGVAYLYLSSGSADLKRAKLRYEEWKIKRKLKNLTVHPGGRSDNDEPPIYH